MREALDYLFDFEWANKNLFYGAYTRTESYFSNSDLASSGLPSADELKILNPLKSDIPPEVFTTAYRAPKTDGTGNIRDNIKQALTLLHEAGWNVKGGRWSMRRASNSRSNSSMSRPSSSASCCPSATICAASASR